MPFNGSGVFQRVRNWVADAAGGIKIRADFHDAEDDGIAAGLTNCITRDGQTIVTQNIPMNSKRITGLADPVNPQDAATRAFTDGKLPLTGGTLTGNLTITTAGPIINLNSTAADGSMGAQGQRNNLMRWLLRVGNGETEPGANAGSNFDLHHYADDGAYLGQVLNFNRATGLGIVKGDPTSATGIATKNYVDVKDAALQVNIDTKQGSLGFTPVQQSGGIYQATNKVYVGWDGSGLRAQVDGTDLGRFFMELNNPPGNVRDGRLAFAGTVNVATGAQSTPYEPFAGAVMTGWTWAIFGGYPLLTACRMRYMQLLTTSWYTVGYV